MSKYIKFIVLSFIAVLILWYFGRNLDWAEVSRGLKQAEPLSLSAAVLIICFGYVLRAFRWRTLLRPLSKADLFPLFEATTVGYAAVFLFGRAGEVVRPLWLPIRDHRVRPTAAIVTIGVERFCDLVAIVLLFAINLIWFEVPKGRESEFAFVNQSGLLLLALTVVGILALSVFQKRADFFIRLLDGLILSRKFVPKRVSHQIHKLLKSFVASLGILFDFRELVLCILWTGLLWFAISVPTWLVITAMGLPLDFSDALFVMGWAVVGSLVPTPGGAAGAFHTATAGSLIFLGVSAETAAATSIIMHFVYFAPALVFGGFYFLRGEVTWANIRTMVLGRREDVESINADEASPAYARQATETGG